MANSYPEGRVGQPPSSTPEIKFTHEMSPEDIVRIANVTGGVLSSDSHLPTYYIGGEAFGRRPVSVSYRRHSARDTYLDFVGYPLEVALGTRSARLHLDGADINLKNTAVVIRDASVSFVHAPEPAFNPPGVLMWYVTISREDILYRRTVLPLDGSRILDDDIMQAADLVDQAVQARYRERLQV